MTRRLRWYGRSRNQKQNSNMPDVLGNSMACHPRATLHIAGWKNSISHEDHFKWSSIWLMEFFRRILFFFVFLMYEGRSISKLQNGVILLIFKLWKFWNIHFAGDLILSTSCDFCYDDVTMTSFINVRYCNVAVEIIPQGTAFCYSFAVSKRT